MMCTVVLRASLSHVLLIAAITFSLCACAPESVTVTWTEDVQLANGQIVQGERRQMSHVTGQLGQGTEYYLGSASLRLRRSGAWLTPEWFAPLRPLVIDLDAIANEFVIVGMPDECRIWQGLGAPDSFYVEYRLQQGTWRQVPLSSFSVGHAANLLLTTRPAQETGHVSLQEKRRRDSVPLDRMVRSIDLSGRNPCNGLPLKK